MLIDGALKVWETEAMQAALMGSMFGMMLGHEKDQDKETLRREADFSNAKKEEYDRRVVSTLLRAKLFQAMNRETEFPKGIDSEVIPK